MRRVNNVYEKYVWLIFQDYDANFEKMVESCIDISTHQACINLLMTEVYKYLHGISGFIINDAFTLYQNSYSLRNRQLWECSNP